MDAVSARDRFTNHKAFPLIRPVGHLLPRNRGAKGYGEHRVSQFLKIHEHETVDLTNEIADPEGWETDEIVLRFVQNVPKTMHRLMH